MVNQILMLALSLLIAAQQPNVPENLKIQATNTALFAIQTAQNELKTTPAPVTVSVAIEATSTLKAPVLKQYTYPYYKILDNGCQMDFPKGGGKGHVVWCPPNAK